MVELKTIFPVFALRLSLTELTNQRIRIEKSVQYCTGLKKKCRRAALAVVFVSVIRRTI